jgi:hypothetical protein
LLTQDFDTSKFALAVSRRARRDKQLEQNGALPLTGTGN